MTFAIVTNDPNITFELSSNGILGLGDGQSLDYEVASNHFLVVSVFDGELSNTATVTVEVRSNQAPILAITNFRVSESISETNIIARIQASPEGAREVFSYRLLSYTNLFEMDSALGDLSLMVGQVIDYEVTNRLDLMVEVFDGEFSNTATVTLEVEDAMGSDDNNYCGVLTELIPVVIDGSSNAFFAGGDGRDGNPYVIAPKDGCEDFTFLYDPNYTNAATLNFQFLVSDGEYNITIVNIEGLNGGSLSGNEGTGMRWTFSSGGVNAVTVLSTDPVGFRQSRTTGHITNGITTELSTDIAFSIRWTSQKSIRFQKQ